MFLIAPLSCAKPNENRRFWIFHHNFVDLYPTSNGKVYIRKLILL